MLFALAAVVTLLIGAAVSMEPYFAGDVAIARALQSALPEPGWWARPISNLAPAPGRYWVSGIAIILAYLIAGWRGLALIAGALLMEHYGAESTKAIFGRPRPSPDLIAVAGSPRGFTFPSTTITFFCASFGTLAILGARYRNRRSVLGTPVLILASLMVVLGCAARVALGAHWPSDVVLTSVICLTWLWAAARSFAPR
jgi:membrane-associated phospholipid phosphatase